MNSKEKKKRKRTLRNIGLERVSEEWRGYEAGVATNGGGVGRRNARVKGEFAGTSIHSTILP